MRECINKLYIPETFFSISFFCFHFSGEKNEKKNLYVIKSLLKVTTAFEQKNKKKSKDAFLSLQRKWERR